MNKTSVFIIFSFMVCKGYTQPTGKITGTIKDYGNSYLSGTNVRTIDSVGKSTNHWTLSNELGNYSLDSLSPGIYSLEYTYLGYKSLVLNKGIIYYFIPTS